MKFISDPVYMQTGALVLGTLFLSSIPVYLNRDKNFYFKVSWASLKSWLFAAPLLFIIFGLPKNAILFALTLTAILGAKVFFKLMGMFHRIEFVLLTYASILAMGACVYFENRELFHFLPMLTLGLFCLVPVIKNQSKNMLQYISLALICLIFMGWGFLHLGWILQTPDGVYQITYLVILTEFFDNTVLATAKHVGKIRIFDRIAGFRTLESTLISAILTVALAYGMRHLLPAQAEIFWIAASVIAILVGSLGDLTLSVFRKDLGVKVTGAFILGRSDLLKPMERILFAAPVFYYVMLFLLRDS